MRKPVRITTWWGKLLYAVGAWCLSALLIRVLMAANGDSVAWTIVGPGTDLAIVLVGARIFRGTNELRDAPRPWWQMTARAKLSRRLGILFIVLTGWMVLGMLAWLFPLSPRERAHTPTAYVGAVASAVEFLILAVLYVTSGRRLKRLEQPTPKRERTDPALSAPFDDGRPRAR